MIAESMNSQVLILDKVMQLVEKEFVKVEKEVLLAKERIFTEIKSLFNDEKRTSTSRTDMKLKFRSKICPEILTSEEIKAEGNAPIEVALVDDPTEKVVDDGLEASASVEIVLLKGEADVDALKGDDWTVEEFNESIIPEVEGKKPLLGGNKPLKLQRGIGVVKNVICRHHASKIRPSVFKLGARVVGAFDGNRVKEAKTESFTVKDFRNKYYKKHETPSLSDEVSRLVNIRKGGNIHKRLQDNQINIVEDFLIRLLIDHEGLKRIVSSQAKKWKATVDNARACPSESRIYCCINLEQKRGVVFNVLGEVLGLYSESHYSPTSVLSENHEADAQELLASAYKNWGNVKPFDDMNSVQQYLTDSLTDYPSGGHKNAETSEMAGESSTRHSDILLHSTMNSTREIGGDDFSWFSPDNGGNGGDDFGWFGTDNGGITCDPMPFSPGWPFGMLEDVYESIQQNCSSNMQTDGLVKDPNAD